MYFNAVFLHNVARYGFRLIFLKFRFRFEVEFLTFVLSLIDGREAISMNRTIFQEIYQMKKLLQASTAIIGVAMIASSAHANLEISGTGILGISLGSGEGSSDTMQFDQVGYYIGFSGSKKTDSGLTLSGGAYLDDSKGFNTERDGQNSEIEKNADSNAATWDKTNFAISGDFGKVEVSNKNDASDLSGYSGYIAPGAAGLDGYGQLKPTGYYKTNMEIPRGLTRISYFSPNINGFSAGFSMMESGGDSEFVAKTEASATSFSYESKPVLAADGTTVINAALPVATTLVQAQALPEWTEAVGAYDKAKAKASTDAASGHQSAIAIGVKYVSPFGLTVGYGNTSYARSYTVKGYQASSFTTTTGDFTEKAAIDEAFAAATDPDNINGEYSSGWTGTRLNIGYAIGPVSFGYTSTTKEGDVKKVAGVELKDDRKTEAQKADLDDVNTTIGLSYNYGAGTVGYNSQTEDYAGKGDKAETATVTVIGVIHTITPGVQAYLNQISGEDNYDKSKEGLESASELVIGLNVSF